jgi:hypothetical protein
METSALCIVADSSPKQYSDRQEHAFGEVHTRDLMDKIANGHLVEDTTRSIGVYLSEWRPRLHTLRRSCRVCPTINEALSCCRIAASIHAALGNLKATVNLAVTADVENDIYFPDFKRWCRVSLPSKTGGPTEVIDGRIQVLYTP